MKNSMNGTILLIGLLVVPTIFGAEVPHSSSPLAVTSECIKKALDDTHFFGRDNCADPEGSIREEITTRLVCHVKSRDELHFAIRYLSSQCKPTGCCRDLKDQYRNCFLAIKNAIKLGNTRELGYDEALKIVVENPGLNWDDTVVVNEVLDKRYYRWKPLPSVPNDNSSQVQSPSSASQSANNSSSSNLQDLSFKAKERWWQKHITTYGVVYIASAAVLGLLVGSLITYKQYEKDIVAGKTQTAHNNKNKS